MSSHVEQSQICGTPADAVSKRKFKRFKFSLALLRTQNPWRATAPSNECVTQPVSVVFLPRRVACVIVRVRVGILLQLALGHFGVHALSPTFIAHF